MKKVLEVRIYEYHYSSEEEMDEHVQWMKSQGFECKIEMKNPILKARFKKAYDMNDLWKCYEEIAYAISFFYSTNFSMVLWMFGSKLLRI